MSAIVVLLATPAIPLAAQSLSGFTVTLDVDGSTASAVVGPGVEFDPAPADARFSMDVLESGGFRLYNSSGATVIFGTTTYRLELPVPVTGASLASSNVVGIGPEDVTWTGDSVSLNVAGTTWGAGAEALVEFSFQLLPASWVGDTGRARSLGDIFDVATAEIGPGIEFEPAPGFAPLAIDVGADFVDFISLTDGFQWTFGNRSYDVTNLSDLVSTGVIVGASLNVHEVSQLPPQPASFSERAVTLDIAQSTWTDDSLVRIALMLSIGNAFGLEVAAQGNDGISTAEQVATVGDAIEFPSLTLAPEIELEMGRSSLRLRNTAATPVSRPELRYAVDGLDWSGPQIERVLVETRSVGSFGANRAERVKRFETGVSGNLCRGGAS